MAFLSTNIHQLQTTGDTKTYQVVFDSPQPSLNVTATSDGNVAAQWVAMFQPVLRSFFPVGVSVHADEGSPNPIANVLTICAGQECLIFQLFRGHLNRDVTVFLRDVCTCYGWQTDAYADLLVRRRPNLSLGRLTDIQTLTPNGDTMGLGDFSVMAFGRRVPEPTVTNWTTHRYLKKNQIRETVLEAHISQVLGRNDPNRPAPPYNTLSREISNEFPQINLSTESADRKVFHVSIGANQTLRVTYTTRASVLTSWLSSLGRQRPNLIGIEVTQNHRGRKMVMGLASGTDCMAYNLYEGQDSAGCLVSHEIFDVFLNSNCPFVGWRTTNRNYEALNLGLRPERVFDVKTEFPHTHTYEDLARMILGYEMPELNLVGNHLEEGDIMAVAVQAYVCLMGGLDLATKICSGDQRRSDDEDG